MQKTVVLINGEKQVGKSTYANHLVRLLEDADVPAKTHSFVRPIEGALRGLIESSYGKDYADQFTYEEIKKMDWAGVDGRTWMIEFGNAARRILESMLPKLFFVRADQQPLIDVWVIENWGFTDELRAIREEAAKRNWRVITVALTYRASRKYACGEQFDGDNRFNLDCVSDFVNLRVNHLARIIDSDSRVDRYPYDSVARAFGQPDTQVPLSEALNLLDYDEDGQWESDMLPSIEYLKMVTGDNTLTISQVLGAMNGRKRSDYHRAGIEIETRVGTIEDPVAELDDSPAA